MLTVNIMDCGEFSCEYCSKKECICMMNSKDEMRMTKANLAHLMDNYIRNEVDDDDIFRFWLAEGVPDGSDVDFLYDLFECPGVWENIVECFGKICKAIDLIEEKR